MRALNLPEYSFSVKQEYGKNYIFDNQRKKYVVLTPEEWVRQNFVQFLIQERSFPAGRIALEKTLNYNGMKRRCDILAYDRGLNPFALVECKAPEVVVNRKVFDQGAVYNLSFKVPFLMVTNGLVHYCAEIDFNQRNIRFLKDIPDYPAMTHED